MRCDCKWVYSTRRGDGRCTRSRSFACTHRSNVVAYSDGSMDLPPYLPPTIDCVSRSSSIGACRSQPNGVSTVGHRPHQRDDQPCLSLHTSVISLAPPRWPSGNMIAAHGVLNPPPSARVESPFSVAIALQPSGSHRRAEAHRRYPPRILKSGWEFLTLLDALMFEHWSRCGGNTLARRAHKQLASIRECAALKR